MTHFSLVHRAAALGALAVTLACGCGSSSKPAPASPPVANEQTSPAGSRPAAITEDHIRDIEAGHAALVTLVQSLTGITDCVEAAKVMRTRGNEVAPAVERGDNTMRLLVLQHPDTKSWLEEAYRAKFEKATIDLATLAKPCMKTPEYDAALDSVPFLNPKKDPQ